MPTALNGALSPWAATVTPLSNSPAAPAASVTPAPAAPTLNVAPSTVQSPNLRPLAPASAPVQQASAMPSAPMPTPYGAGYNPSLLGANSAYGT